MRLVLPLVFVAGFAVSAQAEISVENVRASQRPHSNVVEVFYDLVAPEGGVFEVSLAIAGGGVEPPVSTLSGDVGADVIPGRNKKIEWDAGADWPQHVQSNFVATVTAVPSDKDTGPSAGMARIPGGTNSGVDPDFGSYSLTVESFYMDKTEVTYAHWRRVYNWAVAHGYTFDHGGGGKGNNHPVHSVNWYDCVKWCNARSEMEGRTPAYRVNGEVYRKDQYDPQVNLDVDGYRLPTTTEWQYAARGGLRGRRFPWGDTISHSRANYYSCGVIGGVGKGSTPYDICKCTDYFEDRGAEGWGAPHLHPRYGGDTSPVGSFAPNGYGLYDMAGNVPELFTNSSGSYGGLLGGGSDRGAEYCRIGYNNWYISPNASGLYGFRAVRRR